MTFPARIALINLGLYHNLHLAEDALKNELTGECDTLLLRAAPGQTVFSFRALHCGQVRVHVRRAVLTGLSGLCCKRVRTVSALAPAALSHAGGAVFPSLPHPHFLMLAAVRFLPLLTLSLRV